MDNHPAHPETGWGTKSVQSYLTGFLLALMLTLLSFGLVVFKAVSVELQFIFLSLFAVLQLIVHSVFFLRFNRSTEGKWNLFPFLFVILITAILVGGTLWIMYNLNYNMMMN